MLVDKKILESERNQVYVKSNEGVRLNGSVAENKDVFDKFPQLIMNKYNELIDLLIASGLDTVADDFLNRYTKTETNSLVETETAMLVADVDIDLNTGVITVTKKDGSNTTIDTALEKVPSTFEFVEDTENDKFYLKVTNVDGTSSQTEVTNLMNQYTFSDGDIVSFVISKSGTTTTVTANIKNGSIGLAQLSTEVKQYYEEIKSSVSADRAAVEADKAVVLDASQTVTANTALALSYKQAAEENALLSKSYAIGNTGTRTGEDTDNSMYYSNEAKYARNQAQAAQAAAEKARDEAQEIVGGDYANITPIIIPAGRMRGDVDGDGKITQGDRYAIQNGTGSAGEKYYGLNLSITFPDGNVPLDYLAADINGDLFINQNDTMLLSSSTFKAGAYAEITGNWTSNPNYAAEESQFYADIPITGMTANHSAAVLVKGEFWKDTFIKAECIAGAIRIYTKFCPIAETQAVVSWGSGNGTAVITSEKETNEQEIFVAEAYVTTYEEISKAYLSGKPCFCKKEDIMYLLCGNFANSFLFSALITDFTISDSKRNYYASYLKCKKVNDEWVDLCENGYVKMLNPASNGLPDVTTADNGKILQVVDGVWTAVTPS